MFRSRIVNSWMFQGKLAVVRVFALALGVMATTLINTLPANASSALNFFQTRPKLAYVFARTVVLDDNGEPILVEYNDDGTEAGVVNLNIPASEATVIAASQYRAQQAKLALFNETHKNDLARAARLLTRAQYDAETFLAADNETALAKPALGGSVKSVLVRGQADRYADLGLVLETFTVNLTQGTSIADSITSIVLDQQGNILESRVGNIAPRSRFYGDDINNPNDPTHSATYEYYDRRKHEPLGAVPGIGLENLGWFTTRAATDERGQAGYIKLLGMCPPWGMDVDTLVTATVPYAAFTHNGAKPLSYFMQSMDYDFCMGVPNLGASLIGKMVEINIAAILATQAIPVSKHHFYIDVMMLTGLVNIANPDGSQVSIGGQTQYKVHSPDDTPVAQGHYDFDADGKADLSVLGVLKTVQNDDGEDVQLFTMDIPDGGEATHQGVYLSSGGAPAGQPDFIRLADTQKKFAHTGFLTSISKDDLKNTDILVFRESTGELVVSRRGLSDAEAGNSKTGLTGDSFYYRMALRGGRNSYTNVGAGKAHNQRFEEWSSENGFTDAFKEKNSNHLKPGEWVKLVVINRATGYMGTQRVQLDNLTQPTSLNQITLYPPNLKIWAERKYKVEQGLTQSDDDRKYLIGAEGAGLTSDSEIKVFTEWYDHDGSALPAGLSADDGEMYGLTGRLAKIVAPDMLQGVSDSDLANFPIPPGRSTQVVQIKEDGSRPEHFYIHVSGTQKDENPSFDQTGAGPDALATRPAKLTPFLTPLYSEATDNWQWLSYNALKKAYEEADEPSDLIEPNEPVPSYVWLYRPEYQYSRFGFEHKLTLAEPGDSFDIDNISSGVDVSRLEYIYEAISSGLPRLSPIDGQQTLVLSVGETELPITLDQSGSVKFGNTEFLSSLDTEDFISLRLYTNEDAANILWEFAFPEILMLPADYSRDGEVIKISADDINQSQIITPVIFSSDESLEQIAWEAVGQGTVSSIEDGLSPSGVYPSEFTIDSPKAGTRAKFVASIDTYPARVSSPTYEVVPGQPAKIEIFQQGKTSVGGLGKIELEIKVEDQFGNGIDGASLEVDAKSMMTRGSFVTDNGVAKFEVVGSNKSGTLPVKISLGDISETIEVTVHAIDLTIEVPDRIETNSNSTVNIVASSSYGNLEGLGVALSNFRGILGAKQVTLDASGRASTFLSSERYPGDGFVTANVGEAIFYSDYLVFEPNEDVYLKDNVIVADGGDKGSFDINGAQIEYTNSTELVIKGAPGESYSAKLGDYIDPVIPALAHLPLKTLSADNSTPERIQNWRTTVSGNASISPFDGKFQGMLLDESTTIKVFANTKVVKSNNIGFVTSLKHMGEPGVIAEIPGSSSTLSVNAEGILEYKVITESGPQSLLSDSVQIGSWVKVGAHYVDGKMYLQVDEKLYEQAVDSPLKIDNAQIEILLGRAYTGYLADFKLFDWDSAPFIQLEDESLKLSGTFDDSGIFTAKIVTSPEYRTARIFNEEKLLEDLRSPWRRMGILNVAYANDEPCFSPSENSGWAEILVDLRKENHCARLEDYRQAKIKVETATGTHERWLAQVSHDYYKTVYSLTVVSGYAENMLFDRLRCIEGFFVGTNTSGIGIGCEILSGVLVVGDIRDFGLQAIYLAYDSIGEETYLFNKYQFALATLGILGNLAIVSDAVIATLKVMSKHLADHAKFVLFMERVADYFMAAKTQALNLPTYLKVIMPITEIVVAVYEVRDKKPEVWAFLWSQLETEEDVDVWMKYGYEYVEGEAYPTFENPDDVVASSQFWFKDYPVAHPQEQLAFFAYAYAGRIPIGKSAEEFVGILEEIIKGPRIYNQSAADAPFTRAIEALKSEPFKGKGADAFEELAYNSDALRTLAGLYTLCGRHGPDCLKHFRNMLNTNYPPIEVFVKRFSQFDFQKAVDDGLLTPEASDDLVKVMKFLDPSHELDSAKKAVAAYGDAKGAGHHLLRILELIDEGKRIVRLENFRKVVGDVGNREDDIVYAVLKGDGSVDYFVREEVKAWTLETIKRSLSSKIRLGRVTNAAGNESDKGGQMFLDFLDIESGNIEWGELKWFFSANAGMESLDPSVVKSIILETVKSKAFKAEFIKSMRKINPAYNSSSYKNFVKNLTDNYDDLVLVRNSKV
ncbi:hypothetical protein ACFSJ3_10555 [Corallincola platygyrae]|uniref:Uncharacterized protein n=1 Tax=Corallincola platygyrae TaxID=1193278 RepID=A0ABW4XN02_9GAMM